MLCELSELCVREDFTQSSRSSQRNQIEGEVRGLMNATLKKALLFLAANLFFAVIVIAVYGIGYEYDKANKLYPESKQLSYDVSMQVYGQRWERVAKTLIAIGIVADAALLLVWYRKQQSSNRTGIDITATL
jgi:hypothetical protein